jgi:hypothetical protein
VAPPRDLAGTCSERVWPNERRVRTRALSIAPKRLYPRATGLGCARTSNDSYAKGAQHPQALLGSNRKGAFHGCSGQSSWSSALARPALPVGLPSFHGAPINRQLKSTIAKHLRAGWEVLPEVGNRRFGAVARREGGLAAIGAG